LKCKAAVVIVAVIALASCTGADSSAPAASEDHLDLVSGDRQVPSGSLTLAQPLVVQVIGSDGLPRSGVPVSWKVNDGGKITPFATRTDADGHVSATWSLGTGDEHEGSARLPNGAGVAFSAAEPPMRSLDFLEAGVLAPRTYDGSRQTVHPDFARTPADWGAYERHLALTPYPNGATQFENPSIFVSRRGYRWFPEAGVSNPIVHPTAGYLSDPDIVYVPDKRELWMYYRQADTRNRISVIRSRDGITWGQPVLVVSAPNQTVISPSVVRRSATEWLMWSINGGQRGCSDPKASVELRRSKDGINWSTAEPIALAIGDLMPWHIEVQWIPELEQYWAVYPVKQAGNCATREIFLSSSIDGVNWTTYPTPLLVSGELAELADIVYRSTFSYIPETDEVRFWFSGAVVEDSALNWRTVLQRRRREDVLARISNPATSTLRPRMNVLPTMINPP
jgi:hypothetical protein